MDKFLGAFLESNYEFCHSPADMPPAYKAAGTKPSLCLADRFGEYGAHSCSSGDRCSSLAGAYFCTYKTKEIWLQEVGDSQEKKKNSQTLWAVSNFKCSSIYSRMCSPSQCLLHLYFSMMLFTSTPSLLHYAPLFLFIICNLFSAMFTT